MSERIDFSANAGVYDRRHGAVVSDEGLHCLWSAARLQRGAEVLDVGAGTGRVSIPLARYGYRVVAVEPARAMLDQLRAKAGDEPLLTVVAEGARLPFAAARFDVVVIARLLYLTADWRAILRAPGAFGRRLFAPRVGQRRKRRGVGPDSRAGAEAVRTCRPAGGISSGCSLGG